ncbi:hypothetical protein [Actinokineospora terrae]|uniref:Uncharacterized protein n=1 Tax=Actinokineospora terrae TaxID=155974 RepID=A0A1H9KEL5_9PSEU|nr:hypothetical protein [Actinokineospora terrae]SEQ97375.1 hypothetical protein SAMN04487818_101139 [Actinokineospora terrae]
MTPRRRRRATTQAVVAVLFAALAVGLVLLFGPRAFALSGFTGERGTVAVVECGPRLCQGEFTPDGSRMTMVRVSVGDVHGIAPGQFITVYRDGDIASQRVPWRLVLMVGALLMGVAALGVIAVSLWLRAVRREPWETWEVLGRGFTTALGVGVPALVLALVLYVLR